MPSYKKVNVNRSQLGYNIGFLNKTCTILQQNNTAGHIKISMSMKNVGLYGLDLKTFIFTEKSHILIHNK